MNDQEAEKAKWSFDRRVSAGNLLSAAAIFVTVIAWGISQEHVNRGQDNYLERLRLEMDRRHRDSRALEARVTRVEALLEVKITNLTAAVENQSERITRIWDALREDRRTPHN